jgi:hypothetical protein
MAPNCFSRYLLTTGVPVVLRDYAWTPIRGSSEPWYCTLALPSLAIRPRARARPVYHNSLPWLNGMCMSRTLRIRRLSWI